MKAKKATQQKMHHGNSWGNGKQRLEELFKPTFFDRFIKKWFRWKWLGTIAWLTIFWTDSWTIQTDDYFLLADNPSHLNRWQFFFKPKDRLSRSNRYQFLVETFFSLGIPETISHKSIVQRHFWLKYSFQGVSNQVGKLEKFQGGGGRKQKCPSWGVWIFFRATHFKFPFSLKLLHI